MDKTGELHGIILKIVDKKILSNLLKSLRKYLC